MERIEQIDLFNLPQEPIRLEAIPRDNSLTTRQWRLYDHLVENTRKHQGQSYQEILECLDHLYGYSREKEDKPNTEFNNLQCKRELAYDIEAIVTSPTIQMVYVMGKGRFAINEDEKDYAILQNKRTALKELAKFHIQAAKGRLDLQQRIPFGKEKDHWSAIYREDQMNIEEVEKMLQNVKERLKKANADLEVAS